MKKFFAIVAIIATMFLSASCGCKQTAVDPVEDPIEIVEDSLCVAVDSLAVDSLLIEGPVEEVAE